MRYLAHVDLGREVAADRFLERLAGLEVSAGEGPCAEVRAPWRAPRAEPGVARPHLEDDGERTCVGDGRRDVFA